MDAWMGAWMDAVCMSMDVWMDACMDTSMDAWMDTSMDAWMDAWGWTRAWMVDGCRMHNLCTSMCVHGHTRGEGMDACVHRH